ncbi:hypothetical protein WJX74_000386 [Apatococcus lobatus]|uniref:Uncharacterized protein n=1 Tax=Apatococcus lobatus TaxID=904363 RepID=A0AAW1RBE5_9CHLO
MGPLSGNPAVLEMLQGVPAPAGVARGITTVPDPIAPERPAQSTFTAESTASEASTGSSSSAAPAAACFEASGPDGPMKAKPAARKPPAAALPAQTLGRHPNSPGRQGEDISKQKARAKQVARTAICPQS